MDLEAFIKDVLTPVLDHPEDFNIEIKNSGNHLDVLMRARQVDRGRIIGKNGRMISSLRTICKAAGEKHGLHVNLELVEDEAFGQ